MEVDPLDNFEERLQICQEMIKKYDQKSLEQIFVRFLLMDVYGAYEKTIRDAINRRAEDSSDGEFVQYLGRSTRVFDQHEQKFVRPFSTIRTSSFLGALKTDNTKPNMSIPGEVKKAYAELRRARNNVAHGGETRITLDKLLQMHKKAKRAPQTLVKVLQSSSN